MALVNVKKKVEKAADVMKLRAGENVVAACTTNPKGSVKRMTAIQVGGLVGAAVAAATDKGGKAEETAPDSLASRYPEGQMFLVVTTQRLLVAKVAAMSGKPKELMAEWDRGEVSGILVEKGKLAHPMTITFTDGSSVTCEGAKGTDPSALADALG